MGRQCCRKWEADGQLFSGGERLKTVLPRKPSSWDYRWDLVSKSYSSTRSLASFGTAGTAALLCPHGHSPPLPHSPCCVPVSRPVSEPQHWWYGWQTPRKSATRMTIMTKITFMSRVLSRSPSLHHFCLITVKQARNGDTHSTDKEFRRLRNMNQPPWCPTASRRGMEWGMKIHLCDSKVGR